MAMVHSVSIKYQSSDVPLLLLVGKSLEKRSHANNQHG